MESKERLEWRNQKNGTNWIYEIDGPTQMIEGADLSDDIDGTYESKGRRQNYLADFSAIFSWKQGRNVNWFMEIMAVMKQMEAIKLMESLNLVE